MVYNYNTEQCAVDLIHGTIKKEIGKKISMTKPALSFIRFAKIPGRRRDWPVMTVICSQALYFDWNILQKSFGLTHAIRYQPEFHSISAAYIAFDYISF
jgi:hypothetical protein